MLRRVYYIFSLNVRSFRASSCSRRRFVLFVEAARHGLGLIMSLAHGHGCVRSPRPADDALLAEPAHAAQDTRGKRLRATETHLKNAWARHQRPTSSSHHKTNRRNASPEGPLCDDLLTDHWPPFPLPSRSLLLWLADRTAAGAGEEEKRVAVGNAHIQQRTTSLFKCPSDFFVRPSVTFRPHTCAHGSTLRYSCHYCCCPQRWRHPCRRPPRGCPA